MTIATLFDYSSAVSREKADLTAPVAVRRIAIVGGGTAGWITALISARSLIRKGLEITLLESPSGPTRGVGEGSMPWLRGFFDMLGIERPSGCLPATRPTSAGSASRAGRAGPASSATSTPSPRCWTTWAYGDHFDATLLGQFLHRKALALGVRYRSGHVAAAAVNADSAIASVSTREDETVAADLFVDCTGSAGASATGRATGVLRHVGNR